MVGTLCARDKRVQGVDYVVPSLPIDLCFRTYKSPCEILPEHMASLPTVTEAETPPGAKLLGAAPPTKPAFIIALATGRWPSASTSKCLEEKSTTSGGWQLKNDSLPPVTTGRIDPTGERQQQCGTYNGICFDTDTSLHQPQQQPLNVHSGAAGLFSPSGARVSICISRQCSIISVCAPPQSVYAGTVLEPPKRHKARVKFVVTCVRLSNNQLQTLTNLVPSLSRVMPHPTTSLQWLDLAHNQLTSIDPALKELVNLTVLYLHSNLIANFVHIQILRFVGKLRILTLVGNPLERENYPVYR